MDVQILIVINAACVTLAFAPLMTMSLAQLVMQRASLVFYGVDNAALPE